ncbi:MAG: adenylate/guanylate cyclase domain-containing protein [Kiloniellales bacterium]
MSENPQRRLAAIVSADVAGYSRLMGADEAGTLATLRAHRSELWIPTFEHFGGRVVGTAGDSILVEFLSAVAAVESSLAVQRGMMERNADLPQDKRMLLRVGINIGEVIDEGGDIYGDGVNIAARLEGLSAPGGIALSGNVYEQVRGKLDERFEESGEHEVKNIDRPVRVWRWGEKTSAGPIDVSQPVPGFADRPAIAVLPFENLSQDPEQNFFADGIAEDILTRLATWRWLPVIARNSSFTYKGRLVDVKDVGRDLGARYVLEGSVRKAGNRVRITGQLIDTETGHHVWADRYDRALEDIFAVQDEITDAIVAALEPAVGRAEMQRAQRKNPENLDAWDYYQRGLWFLSKITEQDLKRAREMLMQSVAADPNFASPLAGIGLLGFLEITMGFTSDRAATLAAAREAAYRAARLDELDPFAQAAYGYICALSGEHDAGIAAAQRAVELNPSFALGYHCLHAALFFAGRFQESLDAAERACRISPNDPWLFYFLTGLSACNYMMRHYKLAVEKAKISVERYSQYASVYRWLAVALAQLGRTEEAHEALSKFLELSRGAFEEARYAYAFREKSDLAHYLDGLRKAGLPE